jgi:KipI family sensor histidine kinase inhibitor
VTAPHDEGAWPVPRVEPARPGSAESARADVDHGAASSWRWQLVGDDGLIVDLPDAESVARVGEALRAAPPAGVVDVVPAARTVLVRGVARVRDRWAPAVRLVAEGSSGSAHGPGTRGENPVSGAVGPRLVEIPVVYDGDDLADVARLAGLTTDEVVARHAAARYRVAFGGFIPGFAYLTGLDPALVVPRLATPRTRVPAGAVAIAGEYAAVYPRPTPGGWRLLGHTDVVMFDPAHDERPALLAPGDEVRFVATPERVVVQRRAEPAEPAEPAERQTRGDDAEPAELAGLPTPQVSNAPTSDDVGEARTSTATVGSPLVGVHLVRADGPTPPNPRELEVLATGPLVLVEDAGRPGLAAVGVPRSGAADPAALRAANRLVGNRADAAVLEVVLGGLVVRFGATTAIALVGAELDAELDGRRVAFGRALRAPAGATLVLGVPATGLRTWLAVRGGVDVGPVLGSRSTDVLSALGPAPVAAGAVLPIGSAFEGLPEVAPADAASITRTGDAGPGAEPGEGRNEVVVLPATPGPRIDLLDDESQARLGGQEWVVTADSNRVALRLDGPPLARTGDQELPSEGLVLGAVQVPHDGRPVIFGPDHPVTGGYPVVAVLTAEGITRMAQRRPGDRVRLAIRDL